MTDMVRCRSTDRRAAVRAAPALTGIDAAEYRRFADDDGIDATQPLRPRLRVRLLGAAPELMLRVGSWSVDGGRRVTGIRVVQVTPVEDPEGDAVLELGLDREGDTSTYTVRVVRDRDRDPTTPDGVDPRYDHAEFSFKLDCAFDLDCADAPRDCPTERGVEPVLDYLAKDYASFRQLMLDRASLVLPAWTERHIPDVGIALIELMAQVGDQLSYRQDVVATEAYLDTARLRTSLRRHARLVDYAMHEGANARAWVTVCVDDDVTWPVADVAFYTRVTGWPSVITSDQIPELGDSPGSPTPVSAPSAASYQVFLPVPEAARHDGTIELKRELGRIRFYTWGGEECCLPRGSTRATLVFPARAAGIEVAAAARAAQPAPPLAPGDVLIVEEVLGPNTGRPEHADPSHRHAVRLTRVEPASDPLAMSQPGTPPDRLYEVEWTAEDALPFPLCLSALDPANGCAPIHDVSVARGNVILVDHGRRIVEELGCVETEVPPPVCEAPDRPALQAVRARRFRPVLARTPVTFRAPLPVATRFDASGHATQVPPPASVMLRQDPRAALAAAELDSGPCCDGTIPARCARCGTEMKLSAGTTTCAACGSEIAQRLWTPRRDLFASNGDEPHFVVEVDDDARAHLRFGDGINGLAPEPWTGFRARYRIGNGPAGNVPSEAIAHVSVRGLTGGAIAVRNPLPAVGGVAPEPVDDVRLLAPAGLRDRRERAVIADDYAELALRDHPALQRAAARLRWTGSWYEVLVGLDPRGTETTSPELRAAVEHDLERFRRIGHDLRVDGASYVPVLLELKVCAMPEFVRGHVRRAVLDALVGRTGLFRPDRFSFGQPLVLSALVAAVQAVPGVLDVTVLRMERQFQGDQGELERGELQVGPLEIVQLENDPASPEHGHITLQVGGGR